MNNILNHIDWTDKDNCCGCMACAASCPKNAITKTEDHKGFLMPKVNTQTCIDCGLCTKVCDFKKEKRTESTIKRAYSLVHNDKEILYNSTSGGAFTIISDYVLSQGGLVVGAVMEDDFTIHHIITRDSSIRDKMRGSKYVQSDISEVFTLVKNELKNGSMVLFTGTPCQCAAIKSFFNGKYSNLVITDFLCHGVPSNKMFKEHISYLENYYGQKLVDYTFRDKKYGWNSYNNNNNTADGKFHSKWINQIYYNFFVSNLSLREGCFNCPYRSLHRNSDITIADFWGVERLSGKKSNDGVSLVLTHSELGETIMKYAKGCAQIEEYPFEKVAYRITLTAPKPNKKSESFWKMYDTGGYQAVTKHFFRNTVANQIKYEIRKLAKKLKIK